MKYLPMGNVNTSVIQKQSGNNIKKIYPRE